jgi:hypothetical protein
MEAIETFANIFNNLILREAIAFQGCLGPINPFHGDLRAPNIENRSHSYLVIVPASHLRECRSFMVIRSAYLGY